MTDRNSLYRIYITKSKKEWEVIEQRLKEIGRKEISTYVSSRASLLAKEYAVCPSCVCEGVKNKIQRSYYLLPEDYDAISEIAGIVGVSESHLIERLIIEPLIHG